MKNRATKWGVLVSRCQPLHQGHIDVIKKALEENDRVLLVVGSADKDGVKRNPFDIETREEMFYSLVNYLGTNKLNLMTLEDWSCDDDIPYESAVGSTNSDFSSVSNEWGSWLYYSIVNKIGRKDFTLYYNDNPEIIDAWFPPHIRNRIKVVNEVRSEYSSSVVRDKLINFDLDYLKLAMPYLSSSQIRILSDVCEEVSKNG